MAPGLGLAHTDPTSYHPSKQQTNGTTNGRTSKANLPKVAILDNTSSVDEVVEALKIAGGCVIKNAVAHEDLDTIQSAI
ncbi:hypothetical protein AC578_1302 [Pseudocercospora eumusae]|uniref:Uncharacterized protein n=1 Tax=Pseudocercospora eumusae TaxID=321146 RepID=A0A139HUF5_9PEZI|nr:hypothetical protein AC578_1302 [Pseudocercospora eumusae]KXT06101.1 hypothetical protein AC578_1302 [Pseudocercospora eumusae]KXT06103.1 hypothetical protein AC578_1302 [Pseudocercospora eumusae]